MPDTKNLCAQIPIELHRKVTAAKMVAGLSISEYVAQVLAEYYDWKENGGANMARENGKERTLSFQISEDLFQRIKTWNGSGVGWAARSRRRTSSSD